MAINQDYAAGDCRHVIVQNDPSLSSPRLRTRLIRAQLFGSVAFVIALGGATNALAQTGSPSVQSAAPAVAEVVVTAEKRGSTVQRTPLSITAITGDQLQAEGISSVTDAVKTVPGVSLRSAGPGQTELEMRGLSSTGGAAPTVGFYLDEAPLTPPAAALNGKVVVDPSLYDLARVEVLRGPQGTLYGSGSMGGTIRLLTNQPVLNKFSGSVEMDASGTQGGNSPNGTINAALNIPLIEDKAALRVVATDKYVSGWIDRVVLNPFPLPTNNGCAPTSFYGCARGDVLNAPVAKRYNDVNWEHLQGGRAELLIQPTDNLKIETTLLYQIINQNGANTYDSPPGPSGHEAHYQPADVKEPFRDEFMLASNVISYDFGYIGMTLATNFWRRDSSQTQDSSESYQNLFSFPAYINSSDINTTEKDASKQFSEELRLTSQGSGPFKWIAGVYYADLTSTFRQISISPALCFLSAGGCAANPTGIQYLASNPYHIKQFAAYGEGSYKITDSLTATVGLRYFRFDNLVDYSQSGVFAQSGNTIPTVGSASSTNTGVTPKFNLSYEPSGHLTVYGTISKGFRPGGVNLPLPVAGPNSCLPYLQAIGLNQAPLSYAPDSVWNYEVGEKSRLFDNRLTVNGSLYYIKWSQIQQPLTLACGYPYTNNAGDAASYGPELETTFRLTPEFTIEAGGTYTHATLTHAAPNTGLTDGTKILNVPEYTENTALVYRRTVYSNIDMTARISNSLIGPSQDLAFSVVNLKSYDIVDGRLSFERGSVTASLYVNNLTDKRAEIAANNTSITFNSPSLTRISTNQPRTVGVDLQYKF